MKQADGEGEGQIAVTEDELKEMNHQVSSLHKKEERDDQISFDIILCANTINTYSWCFYVVLEKDEITPK